MRRWVGAALLVAIVAVAVFAGLRWLRPATLPGGDAHVDGPLLVSAAPGVNRGGMDAQVVGQVSYRDGCLRLDDKPVVWPHGTEWDDATQEVVLPGGERAGDGDAVSGGGGYIAKRFFRVGRDPYGVYGDEGFQLVSDCAGPTGEVAFFNLGSEVTLVE